MKNIFIYSILFFLVLNTSAQQTQFFGNIPMQNYSYEEYESAPQVWSIAQDKRGIMYFATSTDLVSYDGTIWRKFQVANNTVIRSIDIDSINGNIYVGANEEFGYFSPDKYGKLKYTSISKFLDKKEMGFQDIWRTHVTSHGIYFVSFTKTFWWYKNKLTTINITLEPTLSIKVQDQVYLLDIKKGLSLLKDTTTIPLANFDDLRKDFGYIAGGQLSKNEIVIASNMKGIFIYNLEKKELHKIKTNQNIDKYLRKNISYSFTVINENTFAVGTIAGGILIVNRNGELQKIINDKRGLKNNSVYSLFLSKDKNLWAGLQTGISRIDISTPITFYDKKNGIDSYALDVISFKNRIYIATMGGNFYLENYKLKMEEDNHIIRNFPTKTLDTWSFLVYKNRLLTFGSEGVFEIQDTIIKKRANIMGTFVGGTSPKYPNNIFIGMKSNFISADVDTTEQFIKFSNKYIFPEIKEEIRVITTDKNNNLWLGTDHSGIIFVRFTGDSISQHIVTKFQEKHFSDLNTPQPIIIDNEVIILTQKGIYKPIFPENNKPDSLVKFVFDKKWTNLFTKDSTAATAMGKIDNKTFAISGDKKGIMFLKKDTTIWNEAPFVRIPLIEKFIPQKNKEVYIACDGFYVFNANVNKNYKSKYSTLIRKVSIKDSIIFFGNFTKKINDSNYIISQNQTKSFIPEVKYKFNSMNFEFSANFFEEGKELTYSCILENFDDEWKEFSKETKAIYTNIPEGEYIFKVKAKNIYGTISDVAEYKFTILPPWYRSIWAYIIYIILIILVIYIIVKLNTKRLIKDKEQLEIIVKQRTAEINQQKEEIQTQADNLQEANDSIMKQQEEMLVINEELEKLSIVASETDNAVLIFDKDLNLEWVNEGYTKIYGYTIFELQKDGDLNLLKISQNKEIKQLAEEALKEKKSVYYEAENTVKDGNKKWVQTTLTPIFENNKLRKLIAIESDISEIQEAKAQISIKNQQIRASINYAQTIQQAILPIKMQMRKHFDFFLIFKPKDIVSGDFYWIAELPNNEGTLIAEVDCTGHGVPGAFMSLISSTLLSEIVNFKKITDPAKILTELNILVKKTLKQEKTENRDGMDLSICKYQKQDDNTTKITFAGAKQDLFYYKKSEKEVKKIKGNRKSIGGALKLRREVKFTNNEVILNKDDIIYIMSDGFIDQNNSERKRMGSTKFIEILNKIAEKDLQEQKQVLEKTLSDWQGNEPQRDDITLLGIRI